MFCVPFILLCLIVLVTILVLQPYKKPYALYNRLDAVMIILVVAFITCLLETRIVADKPQINGKAGIVAACVAAIVPFVCSDDTC